MPVDTRTADKAAPMASAPLKYAPDGSVAWGEMWESFCALAQEGGPPHRGTPLRVPEAPDTTSDAYHFATAEIVRGIRETSSLAASPAGPGWLAIECHSAAMARWLSEAIGEERVQARADGALLFVPVGEWRAVGGEIKNVITVVAKTTHYWREHLPAEVKQTLAAQEQLTALGARLRGWLRRR